MNKDKIIEKIWLLEEDLKDEKKMEGCDYGVVKDIEKEIEELELLLDSSK